VIDRVPGVSAVGGRAGGGIVDGIEPLAHGSDHLGTERRSGAGDGAVVPSILKEHPAPQEARADRSTSVVESG
jgi:hypothetical protein